MQSGSKLCSFLCSQKNSDLRSQGRSIFGERVMRAKTRIFCDLNKKEPNRMTDEA